MIEASEDTEDQFKRVAGAKLDALLGLCEATTCQRVRLLAYFGEASTPCAIRAARSLGWRVAAQEGALVRVSVRDHALARAFESMCCSAM